MSPARALSVSIVLTLSACGQGKEPGAPPVAPASAAPAPAAAEKPVEPAPATSTAPAAEPSKAEREAKVVAEIAAFADRTCACEDTACVETVQADFARFIAERSEMKGSRATKAQIEEHADRMQACIDERRGRAKPAGK